MGTRSPAWRQEASAPASGLNGTTGPRPRRYGLPLNRRVSGRTLNRRHHRPQVDCGGQGQMIGRSSRERGVVNREIGNQAVWPTENTVERENGPAGRKAED